MPEVTLDDFIAFNDQLAALVEAGVPIDVGLGASPGQTAASLEKINSLVARQISRGASMAEAFESALPAQYRSLMKLWLRTDDVDAALDGASRLAEAIEESRYGVRA